MYIHPMWLFFAEEMDCFQFFRKCQCIMPAIRMTQNPVAIFMKETPFFLPQGIVLLFGHTIRHMQEFVMKNIVKE